jgi:hypothetical protein
MAITWNERSLHRTRYKELGYSRITRDLWRLIDLETGADIGPYYRTKAELLGDLTRYATDYGCEG